MTDLEALNKAIKEFWLWREVWASCAIEGNTYAEKCLRMSPGDQIAVIAKTIKEREAGE